MAGFKAQAISSSRRIAEAERFAAEAERERAYKLDKALKSAMTLIT